MHNLLRKTFLLSFATVSLALGGVSRAEDIIGTYKCEGINSGGTGMYSGTVLITKKGDVYRVTWKLGANQTYTGIGVVQGNVLAVSYYGNTTGVVAYAIEGDTLKGKWTMAKGDGSVSTETLTK